MWLGKMQKEKKNSFSYTGEIWYKYSDKDGSFGVKALFFMLLSYYVSLTVPGAIDIPNRVFYVGYGAS